MERRESSPPPLRAPTPEGASSTPDASRAATPEPETFCGPERPAREEEKEEDKSEDEDDDEDEPPVQSKLVAAAAAETKRSAAKKRRAPLQLVQGRPIVQAGDVPLILAQLQTTSATPDDWQGEEPPAPLTAEQIMGMAENDVVSELRRSHAVRRVVELVPALKIPAVEGEEDTATEVEEEEEMVKEETEASATKGRVPEFERFLQPTAVEDAFAQLSDVGAATPYRLDAMGVDREGTSSNVDTAALAAARKHLASIAKAGLTDKELVALHNMIGDSERGEDRQEQLDEELEYERWTQRGMQERVKSLNHARSFLDSDTSAYPLLRSPSGRSQGALPWAQDPVVMGISDGKDIADFPFVQTNRETPDDFRRDLAMLTKFQTKIALIEQRQTDRKYDAERMVRQCKHSGPRIPASKAGGEDFPYGHPKLQGSQ